MTVNLPLPQKAELKPVNGFQMGIAEAGIKKANRKDLLVMTLAPGSQVAGVFTLNRFCAAPVQVCREHLAQEGRNGEIRALVVNTGNANAGTGESGMQHALETCAALAKDLKINPEQILPFSTGVILEPLPIEKIITALPKAVANLGEDNWFDAAEAIMTTDTQPKATSVTVETPAGVVTITGICKGAGMIHPNMGTMLCFITTDVAINEVILQKALLNAVNVSFNRVSVDGDSSTNDMCTIMANGLALNQEIVSMDANYSIFCQALETVCIDLAKKIAADGEGANHLITCVVSGAPSILEAETMAKSVIASSLVKTAIFGSDANWGRVICAMGYSGVDFDPNQVSIDFASKAGKISKK